MLRASMAFPCVQPRQLLDKSVSSSDRPNDHLGEPESTDGECFLKCDVGAQESMGVRKCAHDNNCNSQFCLAFSHNDCI